MQVMNFRGSEGRNRGEVLLAWLQQWKCCSFPMGEKKGKGAPAKFNGFTTAGP